MPTTFTSSLLNIVIHTHAVTAWVAHHAYCGNCWGTEECNTCTVNTEFCCCSVLCRTKVLIVSKGRRWLCSSGFFLLKWDEKQKPCSNLCFAKMSSTSQIFIFILKSPDSSPCWKFNSFYFSIMPNCIIEGTLTKVAIEIEKESKNYYKEKGQMPPGAGDIGKPCPLSCWAWCSDLSPQRIRTALRNAE